jgi:outer membrane usher protein
VTQANTQLLGNYEDRSGQSYEAQYSKSITSTGSSVTLGAYRHSTEGYMDYQTAMKTRDLIQRSGVVEDVFNSKNRFVFSVGQDLYAQWGQLQLSGSFENDWNNNEYLKQYQIAYSNYFKSISWGINVNRNEDENNEYQTSYSLNFSMPLSVLDDTSPPQFRASTYHDKSGSRQQVGISDVTGEYSEFNYGLNVSREDNTGDISMDVNAGYVTSAATISASISKGKSYNNQNLGISGAVVGHSGGVSLSPLTGDNLAVIEAKKAKNARISGYGNVQVDDNGYAVVPNLKPYSENNIRIDLTTAPVGVELESSSKRVVPYDNAIVLLKFDTKFGFPILVNSSHLEQNIPFGSSVFDSEGNSLGNVGQNSQIFIRVPNSNGKLKVTWENGECSIDYQLSESQMDSNSLIVIDEVCR